MRWKSASKECWMELGMVKIYQSYGKLFTCVQEDNGTKSRMVNGKERNPYYNKKMRVPHQNKNSEFLVLAFFDMIAASEKGSPFLRGIGKFFQRNPDIDVIEFESAVKCGGSGIVNLNYAK